MKKDKIILFALALILLVGIIMVCVKGFKVDLELRSHDTLKYTFDQKFEMNDIEKICKEVFGEKEYKIKTVEVFSDAVYIISPVISESEENTLTGKLDELDKTKIKENEISTEIESSDESETISLNETEENKFELYHDSKVRIRDIVKPYIIPSVISAVIIVIYIAIKYRSLNNGKYMLTVCKTLGEMLVILLEIMAIIVIARIPFTRALVPIVMFIIVICLCIRFAMFESELKKAKK